MKKKNEKLRKKRHKTTTKLKETTKKCCNGLVIVLVIDYNLLIAFTMHPISIRFTKKATKTRHKTQI